MKIELISSTPNPELTIAKAASICYDSKPKEIDAARKMIKAIIKSGHESCIEHASVGFIVSGISRVVSHATYCLLSVSQLTVHCACCILTLL